MDTLAVPVNELTGRQLAKESLRLMRELADTQNARFDTLETLMSELTAATEALKDAVDGVAQRLLPQIASLETALASAVADDAVAAAALAEAVTATAAIRAEADRLNALGAEPTTPIDEAPANPVEPPVVEVPSEPVAE